MITTLLILTLLTFTGFFFLSFYKICQTGKKSEFIFHWAYWTGSFVWEDLLVFSVFHFLVALVTLLTSDLRIGLLFILVFWVIRSAGEALYFFLQQFIEPKHEPHEISTHLTDFKKFFGNISNQKAFMMMQVMHQVIAVGALSGVVLLVLYWRELNWVF